MNKVNKNTSEISDINNEELTDNISLKEDIKTINKKLNDLTLLLIIKESEDSKLDTVNNKIDTVNNKIDTVNNKIDTVNNKIDTVNNKIDNLVNTIAWWIPVRKLRNNFRNKFKTN